MIQLTNDPYVLAAILATTLAASVTLVRHGSRGRRLAASVLAIFAGMSVTLMLAAHNIQILYRLAGNEVDGSPPMPYDFRAYGLLLLGSVLMVLGFRVLTAAVGISKREPRARRQGTHALLWVLAICLPIIPIHPFFGPIGSALATIGLLGMAIAPAHEPAAAREAPTPEHAPETTV